MFRTPLGAALLAVEVLYRDDFESDALIPAVLASVAAYSVVISIFGESTLFAHPGRFPFVIKHLLLYGLLALLVSVLAVAVPVVAARRAARDRVADHPALGAARRWAAWRWACSACRSSCSSAGAWRSPGQGLGLLGGGYGAVQVAISGAGWLPHRVGGRRRCCSFLCLAKIIASSLTIGSGGSAGDFAPSLVIGGLFGGAFGRAAQMLLHDPRIDPGAFALVAMGTFYGGVAHTPLSSLVLVCELAGSYDLLVPLMLAEGIAFVALRKQSLYRAQVPTQRDSPVHQHADAGRAAHDARRRGHAHDVGQRRPDRGAATHSVRADADLRTAAETMLTNKLREIQVIDAEGQVVGLLDEADISRFYLKAGDEQQAKPPSARRHRPRSPRRRESDGGGSPPCRLLLLFLLGPELRHHHFARLLGHLGVLLELHRELALALGRRAQVGRVAEHVVQRHLGHRLHEAFLLLRRDDGAAALVELAHDARPGTPRGTAPRPA